jgi:metal-responsive CopG/Arc/MetJ family transcriptional regulator
MTGYTKIMKTAISIPDGDFERFERVAARHGMNRSEFFRRAGRRFVEELEGEAELTALANAVIERVGQPAADSPFLPESERNMLEATEW